MTREDTILLALASAGPVARFTPVQVQKLFFLLDREAAHLLEGPHFDFVPYDYGPFDRAVYQSLEVLESEGMVLIQNNASYKSYTLTEDGFELGSAILMELSETARQYVQDVTTWVRSLRFDQLVSAIYKKYPEMKANSVFRG